MDMKQKDKRKTLSIEPDVYERLALRGKFQETFSDIIARLLDESEARA